VQQEYNNAFDFCFISVRMQTFKHIYLMKQSWLTFINKYLRFQIQIAYAKSTSFV